MAANDFLHGAEVIEVLSGPHPIRQPKTSVVGIVGTAPIASVAPADKTINKVQLVLSPKDAVRYFGAETAGYTLPGALAAHFAEGGGAALVVNVYDPAVHATGPAAVTAAQVVGVDVPAGRTGIKALVDASGLIGFAPKILIAPGFSSDPLVLAALDALAKDLRAIAIVDAPVGLSVQDALALRAPAGLWNGTSDRLVACYPMVKELDPLSPGNTRLAPMSQHLAGLMSRVDQSDGFWFSPSNREFLAVQGLERPITWAANRPNTEAGALNAAGITTAATGWGMGIRAWGNRTLAWPTVTDPRNFIPNRRTSDVLHESVEIAMVEQGFVDRPGTKAMVDGVCQAVEAFMDGLKQRGAMVDGGCTFDKADNPSDEIALGHLQFFITYANSNPAERITFKSFQDVSLLKRIFGAY